MKFVPVTVIVVMAAPTVRLVGLSCAIIGTRFVIGSWTAADAPPPGAGFTTVTECVPPEARSAAVRIAVSCVPLTKVVCRAIPSTCTVAAATKPVPLMATEADAEPAGNEDGEIWVIAGMGSLICMLTELVEMLVPPLVATIDALPAIASWLVGMTAVTCVLVT
jgi:hypothetical protein